jgi:hypothetical protein
VEIKLHAFMGLVAARKVGPLHILKASSVCKCEKNEKKIFV